MGDILCIVQKKWSGKWKVLTVTAWAELWAWSQACVCAMLMLHAEVTACMPWCTGVWGHNSLDLNQLWGWHLVYFSTPAELVLKCFPGAYKHDCVCRQQTSDGSTCLLHWIILYVVTDRRKWGTHIQGLKGLRGLQDCSIFSTSFSLPQIICS